MVDLYAEIPACGRQASAILVGWPQDDRRLSGQVRRGGWAEQMIVKRRSPMRVLGQRAAGVTRSYSGGCEQHFHFQGGESQLEPRKRERGAFEFGWIERSCCHSQPRGRNRALCGCDCGVGEKFWLRF
jgi:hypothetical protein